MPRAGNLLEEREVLVTAALLAAQATHGHEGFRQRDVRFFVELFSNWMAVGSSAGVAVHNTQVLRCVESLAAVSWLRRKARTPPRWSLTAEGLLGLLQRLLHRQQLLRMDEFFLVYHFLDAYGARLHAVAAEGGVLASRALLFDLDALIHPQALVARERARVADELRRLQVRVAEAHQSAALARSGFSAGQRVDEVVADVERRFPYELNNQKPLGELLGALPENWRREELTVTTARRATVLWENMRRLLLAYDGLLSDLQSP